MWGILASSSEMRINKQALNTILLGGMLVAGGHLPGRLEYLSFFCVVFVASWVIHSKNIFLRILLYLSAILFVIAWFDSFSSGLENVVFSVCAIVCITSCIYSTIKNEFKVKEFKKGDLLPLVNCYIAAGYCWALMYIVIETVIPGSFTGTNLAVDSVNKFVYYSFVTMTTIGYGDIFPVSVLAQRFCIAQAVFGQFYFALIVTYLLNKLFQQRVQL